MNVVSWVIFNALIVLILGLELFLLGRKGHKVTMKEALFWSGLTIFLALLFNLYIYYAMGEKAALDFLTAYVVEKTLSIDNLFVFVTIFSYFKTPEAARHKVLFLGILGAVITRAIFIFAGISLITFFHYIIYIFGLFLLITGIKFLFEKEKKFDPTKNWIIRLFQWIMPVTHDPHETRFFVRHNATLYATPLFITLLSIETMDILFAIDSIPAVFAITLDPFIVYTSNIFAIIGLRSLYFVLEAMLGYFVYLHYGTALVLIFIALKMLLSPIYEISTLVSLLVVLLIILLSIAASLLLRKRK